MIKILNIEHFSDAMSIFNLKEKAGGLKKPNSDSLIHLYLKYFLSDYRFIALGYFEEEQLISWVCSSFIPSLDSRFVGSWNITGLYSKKFDNTFSFNRPEIAPLIKTSFEIAEHRHYWRYYYTISVKHQELYDKLWKKNNFLKTGRYDTVVERVIQAENDAFYKAIYGPIIGNREYTEDFVVKKRTLTHDYRIKYDSLHNLELECTSKNYTMYTQFNYDYANTLISKSKLLNLTL